MTGPASGYRDDGVATADAIGGPVAINVVADGVCIERRRRGPRRPPGDDRRVDDPAGLEVDIGPGSHLPGAS